MRRLSDGTLAHLRGLEDAPDLSGTRYRLVAHLADGGMGSVFRAEDTELRRPVAIKVLRSRRTDAHAAKRVLREARIIAGLEHPGIVPVHDVGTLPDGRMYYVMKLVQGARLDEYCARQTDRAARLRVFERICETVAFAHARGIVHRDLKPQNVMVGAFGEVLVLDWGVAGMLTAGAAGDVSHDVGTSAVAHDEGERTRTRLTADGMVIGTPEYMAPEQARGDVGQIDERSDVYALGAILYYLLTDRPPADRAAFERYRRGEPCAIERPRRIQPRVTKPLDAICLKALAADKAERYDSADALGADVSRALMGQGVEAYRESVFERTWRWVWRYRTPIGLVLAYLLMRTILIFWRGG